MSLKEIFIKNKCDKATKHRYYELYQQDFDKFKNDQINILEIGTFKGESTQSWLDYFSQAKIYTADTFERVVPEKIPALKNNRVQWFKVDSTSSNCKENFKNLNIQFDFIIDDGLHTPEGQRLTFENLIDFLKTYFRNEDIELIVVGMPKNMLNQNSLIEPLILKYIKIININFPTITIERFDERFTSKLAFRAMIDGGLKKKKRKIKATIDMVSATIILQDYLHSRKI